ncbi:cyclin A2, partial [Trifolium medium]|nr:cyclin A2 [Trifolium medium]
FKHQDLVFKILFDLVEMGKSVTLSDGEVSSRLTRARAAALSATGQSPPLKDARQETQKHPLRANSTCVIKRFSILNSEVTFRN